jgi:gliding motility-associated-like protein
MSAVVFKKKIDYQVNKPAYAFVPIYSPVTHFTLLTNSKNVVLSLVLKPKIWAMRQKLLCILFFCLSATAVWAQPEANFVARGDTNLTPVRVCRNYSINFLSISQNYSTLVWTFTGGTPATSTATSVNVSWAANGTYACNLTVTDTNNQTSVRSFLVIVASNTPNPTFGAIPNMCSSDPAILLTQGSPPGGTYFGPGVSNNRFNPGIADTGTHTIGYAYTAPNGCTDTAYSSVYVIKGPNASLFELNNFSNCNGFTTGTPNFTIEIFNTSTSHDSITNYEIVWGDGTPNWDSAFFPASMQHTYFGQGIYELQLIIIGANGCTDTAKYSVVNTSNPASLNITNPGGTNGCAPVTVTFPLSTTNTDTTITYTITWGDGQDTTFKHPPPAFITHTYDTTSCILGGGFFNIISTATNACVSTQSTIQGPFVTQPGKADFAVFPGCAGLPHSLNNMSIPGFTNACSRLSTFIWNFGDGSPPVTIVSNTPVPPPGNHTWMNKGWYNVSLTLISIGANCPGDTLELMLCIDTIATALVTITDTIGCSSVTPTLTNSTDTVEFCAAKNFGWMVTPNTGYVLNNNTTLDSYVPDITFNTPGIYELAFFISNICGGDTVRQNIHVLGPPTITFPANIPVYCDTATIYTATNPNHTPTIHSNGSPITSYLWRILPSGATFINGTDSTSQFPDFILPPASYSITLFATNACGTDSATQIFDVNQVTYGGFTLSQTRGCSPLTTFGQSTSNPLVQHTWYVNNVQQSTSLNTSFTLTNTGTQDSVYQIKLIVYAGIGCLDSIIQYVTVHPLPQPAFGATEVCLGAATSFFDSSQAAIAPITNWLWNFGDGNSSTLQNPTNTYTIAGQYQVSLTTTDTNGCSATFLDSIWVRSYPIAAFNFNYASMPDSACVNDTIFFINATTINANGTPVVAWEWDVFNNGTIDDINLNSYHIFNNPGSYQIKLVAISATGCRDSIIQTIVISQPSAPSFTLSSYGGCTPVNVIATNTSTGYITNYSWVFYTLDSNQNRVIEYTSTQPNPNPIPPFQANILSNKTVFAELTASNGCYTATFTDTINVRPIPIPFFAVSSNVGCSPLTITIQVDGLATGNPDSIVFNFGDGTSPLILKPIINVLPNGDTLFTWNQQSHTFAYNGSGLDTTYYLTLWASNECGDSSYTVPIVVRNRSLQSFFTANTNIACAPANISFSDFSFNAIAVSYCFDFDTIAKVCNGPTAFGRNVSHTYTQPGVYVVAQFTSNWCSSDTIYQVIEVRPKPTVQVSFPANNCANDTIYFSNTTTISLGTILGYRWYFGNGDSSILSSPSYAYPTSGNFQVCLVVFTDSGCDTTYCSPITIFDNPTSDFDFINNVCLNEQPVQFLNQSTNPTGNISIYEWDFGDGNTALQINPLHTYLVAGTYNVKLRVTNTDGCTDSITQSITIYPVPDAAFTHVIQSGDSCGAPQIAQFTNYSNNAGGYYWDFNYDPNTPATDTSIAMHPNHTYTQPGTYRVMLVAKNGLGCSDTAFTTIRIHPFPIPDFSPNVTAGCAPLRINFNNETSLPAGFNDSMTYTWYFGDGQTSKERDPIHIYNTPGTYSIRLVVRTIYGCEAEIEYRGLITVFPVPVPVYDYTLVEFDLYQFSNTSYGGTPPLTYSWNFGDGSTSTNSNPLHRFLIERYTWEYGYPVCLTVTDANGCDSTLCDTIKLGRFTLYVPNAMTPGSGGEEALFLPKGQGLSEYQLMIFDRWGNLLWKTDKLDPIMASPVEGWDGTYQGKDVPAGVYVWRIDAKFANDVKWFTGETDFNNSGTITIIR